jgi:hypothetical protein
VECGASHVRKYVFALLANNLIATELPTITRARIYVLWYGQLFLQLDQATLW